MKFQADILMPHTHTHTQTSRNQYVPHFFKVGGITRENKLFCCSFFCLTSRSAIFQSFWDGATASWVFTSTLRTLKCLAQGHYTANVGFEPWTSRSGVQSSTTEPQRLQGKIKLQNLNLIFVMSFIYTGAPYWYSIHTSMTEQKSTINSYSKKETYIWW